MKELDKRIIQITSGRGPAECCWVVAQVLKIFHKEVENEGIKLSELHRVKGPLDRTLSSVIVEIEGVNKSLQVFLKRWLGTVQWIGQSQFRKFHKRKNWFVGVNELKLDDAKLKFHESEIRYEAFRASGPGGQHVNKVSTAIRAIHQPTGLAVTCSESRSQAQNKKLAKEKLLKVLKINHIERLKTQAQENWQKHNELERGNPVRVFKGRDFKSEYVQKSRKSERKKAKTALRKWDFDDDT
ncbi:MAG: peptide chain release factor H [Flavobacteriales bacterium]|nr:peptide chain release factor H [Flavobacteriales bacterium]